ncbi:MAG TPA: DNA replication/repair protein RecF [Streptosporangiaceae bacterium]|nr:DNA replication/repair protein RecF [Streptosporangiaceae bacterium]
MHLTRLALTDFRSYAAADLALDPGVSTLLGANGQGKTNVVEAAGYVSTLGSHRVGTDAPLVRRGAERAILRAAITSAERDSLVEIEINPGRANRARVNRVAVPRPRQVLGILRSVLFAPEDLALVKGDPDQRRRYLDELLVTRAPRYAGVRSDYERVVRQRTALLKSARSRMGSRGFGRSARPAGGAEPRGDGDGQDIPAGMGLAGALDAWDEHLVVKGAELLAGRLELTAALRPLLTTSYAAVSGDDVAATIVYRQRGSTKSEATAGDAAQPLDSGEPAADRAQLAQGLREALARSRPDELDRGVCLIGPHRDDLELEIGKLPSRGYASHGESWSMALALRLSGYELLRADGDDPVLLLDDVFAELDAGRRDRLASLVADAEQVLVTAAVPEDVPVALRGARFSVADGEVTRAD